MIPHKILVEGGQIGSRHEEAMKTHIQQVLLASIKLGVTPITNHKERVKNN